MSKRAKGRRSPETLHRSEDQAVYIISVAAELAGVHPQTLRIYERKGLLTPARTAGNTRRYSDRDIERLRLIHRLTQQEGLNLAGVRMIVEMEDRIVQMRLRVEALDRELREARERMARETERTALETERLQREYRGRRTDIVPAAQVRPFQLLAATARRRRPGPRRGPIAVGPASE